MFGIWRPGLNNIAGSWSKFASDWTLASE